MISENRLLMLTALASVATAVVLITIKLVAWQLSGSVAMLGSLVDSLMDSAASLVNLFAIRYALVPADAEHRFGHGKAEALAGLGQALLITGSALFLFSESVQRLWQPQPVAAAKVAVLVMLLSTVLTIALLLLQRYAVKRTGSTAIQADSLHYFADVAMNVGILLAIWLASAGWLWVDGGAGIAVALYVLYAAWGVGQRSIQVLLDREMPLPVRHAISAIVASHHQVLGFHQLRTRQSGPTCFIQLHLDMAGDMTLREAHELADQVEQDIRAHFPNADVLIHPDPVSHSQALPVPERRD